jgi:hypothetical protein
MEVCSYMPDSPLLDYAAAITYLVECLTIKK